MASLVDELYVLIEQNHIFQAEIKEIGEKFNLLNNKSSSIQISKGLADLKKEGWFSEKEYEKLISKQSWIKVVVSYYQKV